MVPGLDSKTFSEWPDSRNGALTIVDWHTGSRVHADLHVRGELGATAVSPDGKTVAAETHPNGPSHSLLRLWHLTDGTAEEIPSARRRVDPIAVMAFDPTGHYLAFGSALEKSNLLDLSTGNLLPLLPSTRGAFVESVAFSPDGSEVAFATDSRVRVWNVATGKTVGPTLDAGGGRILSIALTSKPHLVAIVSSVPAPESASSWKSELQYWNPLKGSPVGPPIDGEEGELDTPLAFSPGGGSLASTSNDGTVTLWAPLWDAQKACDLAKPYVVRGQLEPYVPDGWRPACDLSVAIR